MSELIKAMAEVNDLNRTHGVVQRGGKKYTEVFVRVEAFRKAFGTSLGIVTNVVVDDGHRVVVKAEIIDDKQTTIGSGYAEEIRGQGNVNKTSALENAETSAIGRALASLGLHGGAYASINELDAVPRKEAAMQNPAPVQPAPQAFPPVDNERAESEAFTAQRLEEIKTIKSLDELKAWDDYFSTQLDRLNINYPDLYAQIEHEANKRKAML